MRLQSFRRWGRIRRVRGRVWKAEQEKTDAEEDHYCRRRDSADSHEIEQGRSFLRGYGSH